MNGCENYTLGDKEKAAIRIARIFRGLNDEEFESTIAHGRVRGAKYEKDSVIAEAESRRNEFLILLSGRIQGVREYGDGMRDFVQLFVPGEICGLDIVCSASRKCPFHLIALENTDVVFIDYDGMFSGKMFRISEKRLHEGVKQALATESLRRLHKIDVLYRRALRDRITVYLSHLSAMKGNKKIQIQMNREQFAQYLGVNRSALSHELSCMQREGLILFRKDEFEIFFDEKLL